MNDLRDDDRLAIACRYFLGLSEEETAAALDWRRGTVKSRTSRALDRLRAAAGGGDMTELERALVRLGDGLAFPEAPDVSERVLARLAAAEPARPRRRRRALVIALAVLVVAVAAAMAVPQARTAILEFFRLRGATVQRVESLPRVPEIDAATARVLELGRAVPVEDGRPLVKLDTVLVPTALGPP